MNNIVKSNSEVQKSKSELEEEDKLARIKVGSIIISKRAEECYRITEISDRIFSCDMLTDILNLKWEKSERQKREADIFSYYDVVEYPDFLKWVEGARKFIETGDLSEYENEVNGTSTDNALMAVNGKKQLELMQRNLEQKSEMMEGLKKIVSLQREQQMKELANLRYKLEGVLAVFNKKIKEIMQVVATIEIYLGINEELFQIQEGDSADATTPITFRQQVLYMDEEVAVTKGGGLDYDDISKFDKWLITDENYKSMIPEEKGVVLFKPRRHDNREYNNIYKEASMHKLNKTTYVLIRNGENLFRIESEHISLGSQLFPKRNELEKLLEESNDKFEEETFRYKKLAILMQGLIDRSTVLHPLPAENISIFKMDGMEQYFNFIYDAELALSEGRLPFREWRRAINSEIKHGSRVVISDTIKHDFRKYTKEYIAVSWRINNFECSPPEMGVYDVETHHQTETWSFVSQSRIDELIKTGGVLISKKPRRTPNYFDVTFYFKKHDSLVAKYLPQDRIRAKENGYRKSASRVSLKINPSDDFVLNYDMISLEDVNFYLKSRADRHNYLTMMPVLRTIKESRMAEMEMEASFADMMIGTLSSKHKMRAADLKDLVYESIEWWKFKNKIKRGIKKDDAKAYRMISSRIESIINNK